MDVNDLEAQKDTIRNKKEMNEYKEEKDLDKLRATVNTQEVLEELKLRERRNEIRQMIDNKQRLSKMLFFMKRDVLQHNFGETLDSMRRKIDKQRDQITMSYGTLQTSDMRQEPPIF